MREFDQSVKRIDASRLKPIGVLFTHHKMVAPADRVGSGENSIYVKKYYQIAIEQIDDKNPGLLINAINNIIKSIDFFPTII